MENKILRYRHNVINITSVDAFMNIKGGINQNWRDVYFIRSIGVDGQLLNYIQKMDNVFCGDMQEGKLVYRRINSLPKLNDSSQIEYYTGCYNKWTESHEGKMETRVSIRDEKLMIVLGIACKEALNKYKIVKKEMSTSIEKNFIIKIIYWFDFLMDKVLMHWDERSCIKIVGHNIVKEQEYLFFYLLTLIGADVLLIQNKQDVECVDELKKLSKEFTLGGFRDCIIPQCTALQKGSIENKKENTHKETVPKPRENIKVIMPDRRDRKHQEVNKLGTLNTNNLVQVSASKSTLNGKAHRREKDFEELALLASSIVMITVHDGQGDIIGTGSGIIIGIDGYILTNNHVVTGGMLYSIRMEDDEQIYTTDQVIKYNSVLDLAVIRINKKVKPLLVYKENKKLVRGQKVVAIGSPLGLFNSVSDGIIAGFRVIDDVDMIQFTAPISHGSSGGAVLNMHGEVIGISTGGIDRGQNINLAVGYESINMFIKGFE